VILPHGSQDDREDFRLAAARHVFFGSRYHLLDLQVGVVGQDTTDV
jgi:hypothetical protein